MKHVHTLFKGFTGGLLGLLVLAGCSNALLQAPRTAGASPAAVLPAGMGWLTISLTGTGTGGGERTLLPNTPVFSKYELIFTPRSGQGEIPPVVLTGTGTHNLSLKNGSWAIEARAYVNIQGVTNIPDGDYVAAQGYKEFALNYPGNNISIDLRGGVDGGKGVFSYDIAIPIDLDTATLEILDLGDGTQLQNIDLNTTPSGSIALDSGYYLLKISRVKGPDSTVRMEVIHIYDGLTTEAAGPDFDFSGQGKADALAKFDWLDSQPSNTAADPYPLVLQGLDVGTDLWKGGDPLGLLYEGLHGKYVNLDLSACRGDYIPSIPSPSSRPDRDKIVSLILPDTLIDLGASAFSGSTSLVDIGWPDAPNFSWSSIFSGCTALTTIDLSDVPLPRIPSSTFFNCTSLADVKLSNTITSIGQYAFQNCTALTAIDLPVSITNISSWAFKGCTALESIVLPPNITSVNIELFMNCTALKSADLPAKITDIGVQAFFGCTGLEVLICRNTTPPTLGSAVFYDTTALVSIYVPDASVDAYKAATGWSAHASKIKPLSELPE